MNTKRNISLRRATNSDVSLMYRLQKLNGLEIDLNNTEQQKGLSDYKKKIDASEIEVIEFNKMPIGRLRVVRKETIYIGGIQILPKYRGRGIGTHVMKELMADSKKNKKKIVLEVFHNNLIAFNFYKKLGFVVVDENKEQKIMEYTPLSLEY